jgi:hypothetical protein
MSLAILIVVVAVLVFPRLIKLFSRRSIGAIG